MSADPRVCAEHRALLSALLDGELTPDERARVQAHLGGCPECRALLAQYRAIGASVRALPSAHPPQRLTDAIYAATIDAAPRRMLFLTSRLGYSMAAVAAVALMFVVAGYLLVGGYQRGVTPQVANSAPSGQTTWPIYNPIEIRFNKPMNHASVEDSLAIQPPGEAQRLGLSWDGNTLIIGANGRLLKPGTNYAVRITTGARDKWGNRLASDFTLQFGTAPTIALDPSPTPMATLEPTVVPTQTAPPTPPLRSTSVITPSATSAPPVTTATASLPGGVFGSSTATVAAPPSPSTSATSAGNSPQGPSGPGNDPGVTPEPATATPASPDDPTPTSTAPVDEPAPTNTPEPSPTATQPVPSPTPTTAPPAPTATQPAPTETPVTIGVTGAFGDVYWGNEYVQQSLGAPLASAAPIAGVVQGFQQGAMYLRGDTNQIYVVLTSGVWEMYPNTATEEPAPEATTDPALWTPGGALGYLWRAEPSVSGALGLAITQYPTTFSGSVQEFAGGVMLSSPESIYVLYADNTSEFYPNTGDAAGQTAK